MLLVLLVQLALALTACLQVPAKWTLAYQKAIVERDVEVCLRDEHISMLTLWHFTDFKVDDPEEVRPLSTAAHVNCLPHMPPTIPVNCR